jgi:hypothetical protein
MLQPFLAAMPPEVKAATKNLKRNIEQGELAPPLDPEVYRFHREAARARREMGRP